MTPYQQGPPSGMNQSDLPPDAVQSLFGPLPTNAAPQGGGGDAGFGGGQGPNAAGSGVPMGSAGGDDTMGAGPGAMAQQQPGQYNGPGGMPGQPGGDPMMAIKVQFEGVTDQLQMLATAYPMATEELQECGANLARAMMKIAQAVQPPPQLPPVAA